MNLLPRSEHECIGVRKAAGWNRLCILAEIQSSKQFFRRSSLSVVIADDGHAGWKRSRGVWQSDVAQPRFRAGFGRRGVLRDQEKNRSENRQPCTAHEVPVHAKSRYTIGSGKVVLGNSRHLECG